MSKFTVSNGPRDHSWGWTNNTDPCKDGWKGVTCDSKSVYVRKIDLESLNLTGTLDANAICTVETLTRLSLKHNSIYGEISEAIGNCSQLTHLLLSDNKFSGYVPNSVSTLINLKRLEVANNNISGDLPDLAKISGLISFLAENNGLTGKIPRFDFTNLQQFNVSNNNFSGPVPDLEGKFFLSSVYGNPELCGPPTTNTCPSKAGIRKVEHVLMYSGYAVLGLLFLMLIVFKSMKKNKKDDGDVKKEEKIMEVKKGKDVSVDLSADMPSNASSEYKSSMSKPISHSPTDQSALVSTSMVVLTSPVVKGLKFEDLLKAPAELLGRGKHGSLYKITLENGKALVVKRIKDWSISSEEFKKRMQKIDQVRHPNVLPLVAFYCSKQEKLMVYEYQPDGSLFSLLLQGIISLILSIIADPEHLYYVKHVGPQNGQNLDWGSRLNIATIVAESLAFMHKELQDNGIAHGNLKSSNILFNKKMEPRLSEYGLMPTENQDHAPTLSLSSNDYKSNRDHSRDTFKVDMYGLGIVLLELLTGKLHYNNGFNLGGWVHSVVREEWTAEVFDRALIEEGANEERMVNLLQIALKCINPSLENRPTLDEVSVVISAIKDEEDRSIVSEV
ncbi:hypothetical protein Scep_017739 [Stephania cephalantha]|uniref:Protein kinase domain-containing protein n=1 Tax=Stephania cephalantha TaxID=152367 RepID=A0AAP0IQ39_9MAGN